MKTCECCETEFPDNLVQPMVMGDVKDGKANVTYTAEVCAICALKLRNKIHNFSKKAKFDKGSNAHQLWLDCHKFLENR